MPDQAAILIVDDRPEKVLALEAALEGLGCSVVRAGSGREALRKVRERDFAVILLDVNMPGMDGFETASLIRQRQSCRDTPIIFITAFGDEMHASRGYSLGAVDYILAPVYPEVLRTKVSVFVDLYVKTAQVRQQARWQARRAAQLQELAAASVAIHGAASIRDMLRTVADTAREIVGSHQAITLFSGHRHADRRPSQVEAVASFSSKYAQWRDRPLRLMPLVTSILGTSRSAIRLTLEQLQDHPDWERVTSAEIPPICGSLLAAPLVGRNSWHFGMIYLCDRREGHFTDDDEAILVQLAQMVSIAIENAIYSKEREANRLKDEFLATLSHELRTPLNAIMGWTQLLRMPGFQGDAAHGLKVIERNVKAQTKLVDDLLDVSRITTGKMRLKVRPTPLPSLLLAAVDSIRPAADAKNIQIECVYDTPDLSIIGDADRLQQVIWNLLSNATKFTPAGGRITARIEREEGQARLRISDTGQGIDPQFLPYVFDRFRQVDSTSTRTHGGLGLGLAIVRHIVELHGGTVSAESAGLGHGSTFTLWLPLRCTASPDTERPRSETDEPAEMAQGMMPDLAQTRVLLVDDEPDAREIAAALLRRAGARVSTASSARDALEIFDREPVDVLVSDIAMPHEDGYWLLSRLRRRSADRGGATPAVALSAYARDEDRAQMLAAGFLDHLPKPTDPIALATAVARATLSLRDSEGDRDADDMAAVAGSAAD